MGMAASQARLLSLTARMHDIEYKAQKLEAQKLQMANKSTQVYNEYEEALNKTKVQYKTIGSDGSASYVDASIKNLVGATGETKSNYMVHNIFDNTFYCTSAQIAAFKNAQFASPATGATITYKTNDDGNLVDAAGQEIGSGVEPTGINSLNEDDKAKLVVISVSAVDGSAAEVAFAKEMGNVFSESYKALYQEMAECVAKHGGDIDAALIDVSKATGLEQQQYASEEFLTNMMSAGFIVLHKMTADNITGEAEEVNIATDTSLQEVSDETELKKAEAKYEADMRKINAKDKKFDTDLAALEQERNAIKTEMDTLKTVAKDNVERTFKLFS